MWTIKYIPRIGEDGEPDGIEAISVCCTDDGLKDEEIARADIEFASLAETAVRHLLVEVQERVRIEREMFARCS